LLAQSKDFFSRPSDKRRPPFKSENVKSVLSRGAHQLQLVREPPPSTRSFAPPEKRRHSGNERNAAGRRENPRLLQHACLTPADAAAVIVAFRRRRPSYRRVVRDPVPSQWPHDRRTEPSASRRRRGCAGVTVEEEVVEPDDDRENRRRGRGAPAHLGGRGQRSA